MAGCGSERSIGTHFQGRPDVSFQSKGWSSGVEDACALSMKTASFSAGVREAARARRAPRPRHYRYGKRADCGTDGLVHQKGVQERGGLCGNH
jgi:hypothetical protein